MWKFVVWNTCYVKYFIEKLNRTLKDETESVVV